MKAVIFGCSGKELLKEEKDFFAKENPIGFILFARNVENKEQVKKLVADLRTAVKRSDAPILIDQEGGKVQRLRAPIWTEFPPAADFGVIAEKEGIDVAVAKVKASYKRLAQELFELGINVNCVPVLDVPVSGAHDVIGNRAFSHNPELNAVLGNAVCEAMTEGGIVHIVKHIPGHGRAFSDSHEHLPVVEASLTELEKTDFLPFKKLSSALWAMTAHVVYTAIDNKPATLSSIIVQEIIRKKIGFDGLLISDDLSMKALSGSFKERAEASLKAGCDAVLHCNGKMEEMVATVEGVAEISDKSWQRLADSLYAVRGYGA